jgi:hypothetical protein
MSLSTEIAADSPIVWWKLDEASGAAADSSGNGNNGTVAGDVTHGAESLDGEGTSMRFNIDSSGSPAGAVAINGISGFPTGDITAELLFSVETSQDDHATISYAEGAESNEFLIFLDAPNGVLQLTLYVGGTPIITNLDLRPFGGVPLHPSVKHGITNHHLMCSYDTSTGQTVVVIDGIKMYDEVTQSGLTMVDGGYFLVGQDQDSFGGGFQTSQDFEGRMAQVAVYDVVLPISRMFAHYEELIGGKVETTPSASADDETPAGVNESGSLHLMGGGATANDGPGESGGAQPAAPPPPTSSGTDLEILTISALTPNRIRVTFNQPVIDNEALKAIGNYVFTGSTTLNAEEVFPETVAEPTYVDVVLDKETLDGGSYDLDLQHIKGTLEP